MDHILNTSKHVDDFNREMTLREYLHELLSTLWDEGEGFSGKRPFGNSGWEHDIYEFLVKSGEVAGAFDEDGYLDVFDRKAANELMPKVLAAAFSLELVENDDEACEHCERLPGDPEGSCDWVECPV